MTDAKDHEYEYGHRIAANGYNPDGLAWVAERTLGALAERMHIEMVEFTPDRAVARMPVSGNTQPIGLLHGGAYVVLGESLGSMHSVYIAPPGHVAVGVDINATHTNSATHGTVTATCRPVHIGSRIAVHEIVITRDSDGKRCSTVRITNMFRTPPAGTDLATMSRKSESSRKS